MKSATRARSALAPIELPTPEEDTKCISVFQALEKRRTVREIAAKALPLQTLSNLLWAAAGVNRTSGPFGATGRTAASASNSQEIDLYVLLSDGAFLYHAAANRLEPIVENDLRKKALTPGQRDIEAKAPVQLVYVVDIDRLTHTVGFEEPGLYDPEVQKSYYYVDTGLIAGNVYLFAAANGLAAWFHNCDRLGLATYLKLHPHQRVLFAQSVGYPE